MRLALAPAALLLFAGCLGADDVVPASVLNSTSNASSNASDAPTAGVCVIGVDSPCNAPQWRDPNATGAPRQIPVPVIRIGADVVDARQEVEIEVLVEGLSDNELTLILWSFGDGATAEGRSVRHGWSLPGLYTVSVSVGLAGGGAADAATSVGVRLHESFAGTITAGTGLACFQVGVDCVDHPLVVPAGVHNLTATVSPPGPVPPSCNVAAFAPDGTQGPVGSTITIEKPAEGEWILSVACLGPNVAYTLEAIGTFEVAG